MFQPAGSLPNPSQLAAPDRQVGIPASGGQLRRFPRDLYLADLMVEPDDAPGRGDSIPSPETTNEMPPPAEREPLTIKQLVAMRRRHLGPGTWPSTSTPTPGPASITGLYERLPTEATQFKDFIDLEKK